MSIRARFAVVGGAWALAVTVVLVVVALAFAPRLPDPIASHWGLSGAPDDSSSLLAFLLITLLLWVVLATGGLVSGIVRAERRPHRAVAGAMLAGGGVFVCGILTSTAWANLDAPEWRQARSLSWQVFLVLGISALVGAAGHRIAARGPDASGESGQQVAAVRLRPGERLVWTSSVSSVALLALAGGSMLVGVVLGVLSAAGALPGTWAAVICTAAGLVVGTLSSVRVHVSDRGLAVVFGPQRWPVRRVPLERIEGARVEQRSPMQVGGWGYRGLPGNATIMLRGGECLVVRYTSGGELGISVDDAERGAALINAMT